MSDLEKAHCHQEPVPVKKLRPDVPPDLERLVHRCLEKSPAKRPQSAEEIEAILDKYLRATENVVARGLKVAGLAAALLAVLAAGAWGFWELRRDREPPRFTRWEAAAEGESIRELESTAAAKRYETRAPRVTLRFTAEDDRGVAQLRLASGAWAKEKIVDGALAEVPLDLEVGTTTVTAQAHDASGNAATLVRLSFLRQAAPSFRALLDQLPRHTNKNAVELAIDDLSGVRAEVTCVNRGERIFEVSVERSREGGYSLSGPGAAEAGGPASSSSEANG
jgi:hypothetical protein